MDGTAVQKIADLARLGMGRLTPEYGDLVHPELVQHLPAMPQPVVTRTLRSLVDLTSRMLLPPAGEDEEDGEGDWRAEALFLHVVSPTIVQLVGEGDLWGRIPVYAQATFEPYSDEQKNLGNPFVDFVSHEDALIFLKANCSETEDLGGVLRILGRISDDQEIEHADDGVAQKATVRAGLAHFESEEVKGVVHLAPFRTFPEITPPKSPFVFRLRKGRTGPLARLIPADGERWRLEAMESIAAHLSVAADAGVDVIY